MERTPVRGGAAVHWLRVILGALGLAALLAALTVSAYLHNVRVDLSPGDRFTLSDHALEILRDLERPVKMTAFIRTEDARNAILKDLLWQVANETPKITYTIVDVNRNPTLAAQYGVDTYGATVVESGEKRSDFNLPTESQLIAAVLHVTRPPKKLYAVEGHGECSVTSTDRYKGCSGMREALQGELYDVEPLTLRGQAGVPDDAEAVLIVGPHDDFLEREIEALASYLDTGGKLLAMLDPFAAPRLTALLAQRGLDVEPDVIIDPENRLGGGEPFSAAVPNLNTRHLVTGSLKSPPLFSAARSVQALEDEASGRRADWLLKSGDHSWASHAPAVLQGVAPRFVAGRDLNGPLTIAAEVWTPGVEGEGKVSGRGSRIIVFGDSDYASNRFLDYLGNRDLVVNTVNWLTREERLMAARAPRKTPGVNWLFISHVQQRTMFIAAVVVQPLLFLLIGLGVALRRRLSP